MVGHIVSLKKNICVPVEAVVRSRTLYNPGRPTEGTPAHHHFLVPVLVSTEA